MGLLIGQDTALKIITDSKDKSQAKRRVMMVPALDLVNCKDCRKHNNGVGEVLWKEQACPLVKFRGKAQGHEFDYQYCSFGLKKEDADD